MNSKLASRTRFKSPKMKASQKTLLPAMNSRKTFRHAATVVAIGQSIQIVQLGGYALTPVP